MNNTIPVSELVDGTILEAISGRGESILGRVYGTGTVSVPVVMTDGRTETVHGEVGPATHKGNGWRLAPRRSVIEAYHDQKELADLKAQIAELKSYLSLPKFHNDPTVQVSDVLNRLR